MRDKETYQEVPRKRTQRKKINKIYNVNSSSTLMEDHGMKRTQRNAGFGMLLLILV